MSPSRFFSSVASVSASFALLLGSGCGGQKEAVSVDPKKTAVTLENAFSNAPSDIRAVVQSAATSLRENNSAGGFVTLFSISKDPALTPEQQRATAEALGSSLKELVKAANSGDVQAEKTLKAYQARK